MLYLFGGGVLDGEKPLAHEISSSLFIELVGRAEKAASFSAADSPSCCVAGGGGSALAPRSEVSSVRLRHL